MSGKTKFARHCFLKMEPVSTHPLAGQFCFALSQARRHDRMFRVVLKDLQEFEYDRPGKCIAGRLLWEHIKVGRREADFDNFQQDVRQCADISLDVVARFVCDKEPHESSLIILNLDEINVLLDPAHRQGPALLGGVFVTVCDTVSRIGMWYVL